VLPLLLSSRLIVASAAVIGPLSKAPESVPRAPEPLGIA